MQYYLGLHCGHDATATLIDENGVIIAAIAEERVTRVKFHSGFPYKSIEEILRITGVKKEEIKNIAATAKRLFYPHDPVYNEYMLTDDVALKQKHDLSNLPKFESKSSKLYKIVAGKLGKSKSSTNEEIEAFTFKTMNNRLLNLGFTDFKLQIYDHHYCHAASAYFTGGVSNALIITMDGAGDGKCATASVATNGKIELISSASADCSPGRFYSEITRFLGYKRNKHEGKITGLAAFGNPKKFYKELKKFMAFDPDTENFCWEMPDESALIRKMKTLNRILKDQNYGNPYIDYFHEYLTNNFDPKKDAQDLSAAVQYITEEVATEYIQHFRKKYPERNILLAGGVFANVKVNQRIRELNSVNYVYVHQNMGDGGCATGAAYELWSQNHPAILPERPVNVYFGSGYTDEEIEISLKKFNNIRWEKCDEIELKIAKLIHDGVIVGRFYGRMEYGPRALGNRSILVRTTDKSVNDWLNKRLKRTEFMPFAPSVLDIGASMLFHDYEKGISDYTDQFMTITYNVKRDWFDKLQAAVHVDGTARPQVVTKEQNPSYYKILKEYYKLSGIPSFVNTSFNTHEEPIVMTPEDAIRSLLSDTVDCLAMGNYLVHTK